jgi:hypothetical protein
MTDQPAGQDPAAAASQPVRLGGDTETPDIPNPDLTGAGITFLGRYVSVQYAPPPAGQGTKPMRLGEAQELSKAVDLFSNYEPADGGASFLGDHDGAKHGTEDAQDALAGAQTVHQPPGTPIYFSFDFNESAERPYNWPSPTGPLQDYIAAAANVVTPIYTVGVYGYQFALAPCQDAGAQFFWEVNTGPPGYGPPSALDNLVQFEISKSVGTPPATYPMDFDHALTPYFGQWRAPVPTLKPLGLYAAWRGAGTDESLHYSAFSGRFWGTTVALPAAQVPGSAFAPSLALFEGKLFMAYRGARINRDIWITSTADGTTWAQQQAAGDNITTDVRPAMVVAHGVDGQLWLAWHGSDDLVWWSSSSDGVHWAPKQPVTSPAPEVPTATTKTTPALAVWDGAVYMAGTSPDGHLWWTYNSDGTQNGWAPPGTLDTVGGQPVTSQAAPALAAFGRNLYLAWQYPATEIAMISYDGEWGNFQQVEPPNSDAVPGTLSSPALGVFLNPDELYLAWGIREGGLYYASTPDGHTWNYSSAPIPGGPGPGQPQPPALLGI